MVSGLLATLAATVLAAPALSAPVPAPDARAASPVRTSGGVAVFSARDGAVYRLTVRRGARTPVQPLVRASARPFPLAVGRGPDGRTLAVYARCESGCAVFALPVDGGAERRVPGARFRPGDRLALSVGRVRVIPRRTTSRAARPKRAA